DRLAGLFRAHGQDGHLAAVRLGQAEPFLDRVLIELVDDPVDRRAVEPRVVGPKRALSPRVGDLLDADDDVHDRWPTSLPLPECSPGVRLRAGSRLPNAAVQARSGVPIQRAHRYVTS